MFESEYSKSKILKTLSKQQINEIEDEYYSNIEFLKNEFKKYDRSIDYTKIDMFNYVIEVFNI